MSNDSAELALLPNGFEDLLPPQADVEAQSISTLIATFSSFGYRRIKPPLLEFEDSLLAPGPGERLSGETFRLMDPVTHRMLGLRSDITPQIARIAGSRLSREPRPLRLTYANDVLRTKGNQLRTVRQFCQVGCEIIGDEQAESDVEICVLAILGLKAIGFGAVTLDLTIPGFVASLIHEGLSADAVATIKRAVAQRDRDLLATLPKTDVSALSHIMDISAGSKQAEALFAALKDDVLPPTLRADVRRLKEVCAGVERALGELSIGDVSVTVDLLEQVGFEYHRHLGFALFSPKVHGELGRGGCYDVRFGKSGETETAKGFTLYMDTIRKACAGVQTPQRVFVPAGTKWSDIRDLQEKGWTVVLGTGGAGDTVRAGCTHKYEGGAVVPDPKA